MSSFENIPTYENIALRAGVSPKTVCNVLRSPESVRKKNVEAVHKALRELGVSDPNTMKMRQRSTRPRQTKSILFFESDAPAGSLNLPVYSRIINGAENRAHLSGWQFGLRHGDTNEPLAQALRNFRGGGVILFSNRIPYRELQEVIHDVPVVRVLGAPNDRPDCDTVDYDRIEVARIAARHLREKGCKNVGYLGGESLRRSAFLSAAKEIGMKTVDATINDLFFSEARSQVVNTKALQAGWAKIAASSPDGIFVYSDQVTASLYILFAELGIRPGRDIEVVSCNAEEMFLSPLKSRPATIDICSAEIGSRAVDALLWRMENRKASPVSLLIQPKLIPGDSAI
jgi:DNA-binding LacI/PurR family transcriptional regulator